jgi:isoamylase
VQDIAWFDDQGAPIPPDAWNDSEQRTLILRRAMADGDGRVTILSLLLNPTGDERLFRLPPPALPSVVVLDTAFPEADNAVVAAGAVPLAARCAVLVLAEQPAPR